MFKISEIVPDLLSPMLSAWLVPLSEKVVDKTEINLPSTSHFRIQSYY